MIPKPEKLIVQWEAATRPDPEALVKAVRMLFCFRRIASSLPELAEVHGKLGRVSNKSFHYDHADGGAPSPQTVPL